MSPGEEKTNGTTAEIKTAVVLSPIQAKMLLDMMEHPSMNVRFIIAAEAADLYAQVKAATVDADPAQPNPSMVDRE